MVITCSLSPRNGCRESRWQKRVFAVVGVSVAITLCGALEAAPHDVLDLRTHSDSDGGVREVALCARPSPSAALGLPGHMFVGYSLVLPDRPRAYLALGHTTQAPASGALLSYSRLMPAVSGTISDERYTATLERCLVVRVNKPDFDRAYSFAVARVDQFSSDPSAWPPITLSYRLGSQDCVNFVVEVAEHFKSRGLKVPARGATEFPMSYVRRLIDEN